MRGDLLDLVLLVLAGLFAMSGYRQGFVVGALSFAGFLGGGVLGARLAPRLAELGSLQDANPTVLALGAVFVLAVTGQVLGALLGSALRSALTWRPARTADAVAGAVISAVGVLLVAWLLGSALASAPSTTLASQVRRSVVIGAVDAAVPDPARRSVQDLRRLVDSRGFPEVFGGLDPTRPAQVAAPDPALAGSAVVRQAQGSVLKVTGVAPSCSRSLEGTGFVYAPERVMTNAHVVAGVRAPQVQVGGRRVDATVVLYDPGRDVAVLRVPGLSAQPLGFSGRASSGDSALVLGYPEDGPYTAGAARVRQVLNARGPDIYGDRTVTREVYALRADVRPGNSGGPLLDPQGGVLGVVFAAAADRADTGYALTAEEVATDARTGTTATAAVSTGACD